MRVTKFFFRSAALLALSGILLGAAGWAMGADTSQIIHWNGRDFRLGWNSGDSRSAEYTGGERNLAAFKNIDIHVDMADVTFEVADDYGVDLEWFQNQDLTYHVTDGTLTVESNLKGNLNNISGKGEVVIYLPEDLKLENVSLTISMGDADLSEQSMEQLTIDTEMGSVSVYDCTISDSLIVKNSMGDVDLSGNLSGKIDLTNDMGNIYFYTVVSESHFSYDVQADMGMITVNGYDFREHATKDGGSNHLTAKTDMGNIDIMFSDD